MGRVSFSFRLLLWIMATAVNQKPWLFYDNLDHSNHVFQKGVNGGLQQEEMTMGLCSQSAVPTIPSPLTVSCQRLKGRIERGKHKQGVSMSANSPSMYSLLHPQQELNQNLRRKTMLHQVGSLSMANLTVPLWFTGVGGESNAASFSCRKEQKAHVFLFSHIPILLKHTSPPSKRCAGMGSFVCLPLI